MDKTDEKERKVIGSWSRFIDEYRSKYLYVMNLFISRFSIVFSLGIPGVIFYPQMINKFLLSVIEVP